MNKKYSITYPEKLRCLCIREDWFTCGSTRQYEKMFQMNENGAKLRDIAIVIWICSDEVELDDVIEKLHEIREEYIANEK